MPDTPAPPMRRLKKRAQFLRAARGTKVARRGFVLQVVAVAEPEPGVGYTVTKKVGNAPERNRIKRRLREVVRASATRLAAGHDYVLIGRRDSLTEPFDALIQDLKKALKRVHEALAATSMAPTQSEFDPALAPVKGDKPETTKAPAPSGHPEQ